MLQKWIQPLIRTTLNFFFPPTCAGCEQAGTHFCPTCAQAVEPIPHTLCERCGRAQSQSVFVCSMCQEDVDNPLEWIRAAALHTQPLRAAIHHLKYEDRPELAEPLARYLAAVFMQPPWSHIHGAIDAVVPVPLHLERLQERGYNQSEQLASAFCRSAKLTLRANWIERTRMTAPQVGLNAVERSQNVEQAFHALPAVAHQRILLIDDVYTTGATLRACATAAIMAGASKVYALTLAMPVGRSEDAY